MQEDVIQPWVEESLEEGMATHLIFLTGKSMGQREPRRASPLGHKELYRDP